MKNVLVIVGSAQPNSSNLKLVQFLSKHFTKEIEIEIFEELRSLPHFEALQTLTNTPENILAIRKKIDEADAVIISSPEYIFSIPAGLKNLLEWCVSSIVFMDKPLGIIVASADGRKAFEEVKLIMKTLGASFTDETTLLIKGIRGLFNAVGEITDGNVTQSLQNFIKEFSKMMD